jgi:hypothetical protein
MPPLDMMDVKCLSGPAYLLAVLGGLEGRRRLFDAKRGPIIHSEDIQRTLTKERKNQGLVKTPGAILTV